MFLKKFLKNQSGMATLSILAVAGTVLTGIGLVTTQLLPKYFSESAQARKNIHYTLFISSFMDYTVHALKERWCMNESWMRSAKYCLDNDQAPEKTVTYDLNLERIFWTENTRLDILALLNGVDSNGTPLPSGKVDLRDLLVTESKITHTIKLDNISSIHPLYEMTKNVKGCLNGIEVEIYRIEGGTGVESGGEADEIKLRISLIGQINRTNLKCLNIKKIESVASYSFYPRRLMSFSLIKAGNLDLSLPIDYMGPIYVEKDAILPPVSDTPNAKDNFSTVNNKVVLGGGIIKTNDKKPYTFKGAGDPNESYHFNYDEFHGFLGGVSFDSAIDPAIALVFDENADLPADAARTLKMCLEREDFLADNSKTAASKLYYSNYSRSGSQTSLNLALSNKYLNENEEPFPNEFKKINRASGVLFGKNYNHSTNVVEKSILSFKFIPHGVTSIIDTYKANSNLGVYAYMGDKTKISFDFKKFIENEVKLLTDIEDYLKDKEEGRINLSMINYEAIISDIPPINIVQQMVEKNSEYTSFQESYSTLDGLCSNPDKEYKECNPMLSSETPTLYEKTCSEACFDDCMDNNRACSSETPKDSCCRGMCNNNTPPYDWRCSDFASAYQRHRNDFGNLKDRVTNLKMVKENIQNNPPKVDIEISAVTGSAGKIRRNQKQLIFETENWSKLAEIESINRADFELEVFDLGFSDEGVNTRTDKTTGPNRSNAPNRIEIPFDENYINLSLANSSGWSLFSPMATPDNFDRIWNDAYEDEFEKCGSNDGSNQMIVADWDLSFTKTARYSWNFAPQLDVPEGEKSFAIFLNPDTETGNVAGEGTIGSYVRSVIDDCIVKSHRDIIFGFYTCDKLIIEPGRSKDLIIVGSFLVNNIEISDTSTRIKWYSLWENEAIDFFKKHMVMGDEKELCNELSSPIKNSVSERTRQEVCSPISITYGDGPNNFLWTSVDPEVGTVEGSDSTVNVTKVRDRFKNFIIVEQSRKDDIYVY